MPKIDDFYGLRNRRNASDWGVEATRDSISPESSFAIDQSRLKTKLKWETNPAYQKKAEKMDRSGVWTSIGVPPGKMIEVKASVMDNVRESMGGVLNGTSYKSEPRRKER